MNTKNIIFLIVGVLFLGFGISIYSWWVGTLNKSIELENQFNATNKEVATTYDNVWKTIQQKYQIKSEYATDFKAVVQATVAGREGGQLFKFTQEAQPNLSTDLYKDLSATIEGKRDQLKNAQDRLIDIKREHDNLRQKFPSSIVVGSRPELKLELITSSKTQQVISTGKEDDIKLTN